MNENTEIRISFGEKSGAEIACPVAEDMIRLFYSLKAGLFDDVEESVRSDPYQLYILYRGKIGNDKAFRETSGHPSRTLGNLSIERSLLILKDCAEIQGAVPDLLQQSREGFFNCLCFVLAWKYPLLPFEAECRYKADDTDTVQETLAVYDAKTMHFEQRYPGEGFSEQAVTSDWIISPRCVFYNEAEEPDDIDEEDDWDDDEEDDGDDENDGDDDAGEL